MYLVAWGLGSKPQFDDLLRGSAFATGLATFGTLLPDLITSPSCAGPHQREGLGGVRGPARRLVFTWVTLVAYLVLFVVLYPTAVRQATNLSWWRALATGVTGFVVFQGFEYVFIR